ncbi:hypothetical protein [Phenylobacterium sp.]|uniref:hypothetical protein n=1 Tax=Phenylobacterium sp. TaxID=1871053 RepID=UPI0035671A51
MRFKEFGVPDVYIVHHFSTDDAEANAAVHYLEESGRRFDLGQGRSILFHRAHVPNTQDHVHFVQDGRKLYALNRDGTAHDASHGKQMHRWAMDAVKDRYQDFVIPKAGLIEAMFNQVGVLIETASHRGQVHLTPAFLSAAIAYAETH